ncbi:MAG TPA: hypothetical protein VKS01_10700 [Bryobacteraceae bacterium]|nr:hypothetical protein [Bryobacteraceae bacterium]
MKIIGRTILLSMAAAMFIALAGAWARSIQPDFRNEREASRIVRRKLEPQLVRTPSFVVDLILIGLIAVGGRMILGLRLTNRN